MEDYIKITTLDNEIEAELLESVLTERSIPHLIRSYHDTAYDGLFQVILGWGHIEIPDEYQEKAAELYRNYKKSLTE